VRPPLVFTLKSIIERSYAMTPVIGDLAPFIIGDAGFRAHYGGGSDGGVAGEGPRARLLIRDGGPILRAALYYPDTLVRHLERFDPLRGLGDENIEAFATLVEELDHLLTLASRAREGRPISLLELEHHANVTKYLVVLLFLARQAGRTRLPEGLRLWARHHLFGRFAAGEGEEERRYRVAARLAERYVRRLERMSVPERQRELREYQRRPFFETCRILASVN
jgi:hypothetical protein